MAENIQGGDGTPLPPSLMDIDQEDVKPNPADNKQQQQGEPQKTQAEIDAEAKVKADAEAAEKERQAQAAAGTKTEDELAAEAEKRYNELKGKDQATLTDEEKTELKDFEDQIKENEEADTNVKPEEFWGQVDKLHGFENFKVDYGDVEPLSPEGVVIREKAIMERAQLELDNFLKQSDPRGYAYLLHRQGGGTDEDFFNTPSVTLPDYETFKNNVDLQKQFLTKDLSSKGLDDSVVQLAIEKAVKDGKLFELSDKAYKQAETSEKKALETAEQQAKIREQAETKAISEMNSVIDDIVNNSKTEKIVIPDAQKAAFAKAIKDHLYFDGQQFFVIKPFDPKNAAEIIQAEYFGHVKGDIKGLVERTAKTKLANKLRLGVKKSEKAPSSQRANEDNKTFVPFGEV